MDQHPIQGGVAILLVASCYGDRDKLRPDGPLGSYADLNGLSRGEVLRDNPTIFMITLTYVFDIFSLSYDRDVLNISFFTSCFIDLNH